MKIEKVILFTLLVALIFVATIVLFIFKTFAPNPVDQTPHFTQPVPAATTTRPTTTPTTKPNTDNHTALDDCIELKSSVAQGVQYEKGSLLVTFLNSVDYNTAVDISNVVGVNPDTTSESQTNFNSHHWLSVSVPRGEEFKWQCLLEGADGVKKTNLNITFNLAQ